MASTSKPHTTNPKSSKVSAPIAKKRQRLPAEERKAQIIKAARKVFIKLGLNGARTKDLAKEAGVNEATLFLYFKTKEEIFDAAITEPLKELIALEVKGGREFRNAKDPSIKKSVAALAHSQIFNAMDEFAPLFIAGMFSGQDKGKSLYKKTLDPAIKELAKTVKSSFNIDDDERAELIVLTSLGVAFAIHMRNQYNEDTISHGTAAEFIAELMVHM